MIKVNVFMPHHEGNFEYYTSIVPNVGDEIKVGSEYYKVDKRTLFPDNPNYIIIHLIKKL